MSTNQTILADIAELLGDRFGRYSKYTIQHRAIPDARDGLKPVQRRILYSMYLAGNTPDKGYRKSAKTVGDVMGNYHPHGDSSIYDAMVHMAQAFKTNQPLVDGHGNWGSIDKDPPAAMRYTEARLSPYAMEMLADIKKDTVRMIPNFDETDEEPIVLPARLPNLLINGATGIASGFATNIPPHNPKDIVQACVAYLDDSNISNESLIDIVKAPDFPTGCEVMDIAGIREIYETGSGSFVMSARLEIEQPKRGNPQLVFSHIPYNTVKQQIVVALQEIALNKDIDGIVEVRDETDRKHGVTGAHIVVELKKGLSDEQVDSIVAYLYKNTDLMAHYRANMTAIVNGSPERMSLRKFIVAYINHQRDVIRRRTEFDLTKARERFHIVEGYIKALNRLDEVIRIIRESRDRKHAQDQLVAEIELTEIQANAILELRLYRLTNMEVASFQKEWDELKKTIAKLEAILNSPRKLDGVIEKELSSLVEPYSHERLSPIKEEVKELNVDLTMTIPEEEVYVVLTKNGYIKRLSKRAYMGIERLDTVNLKLGDTIQEALFTKTTDTLLLFTQQGTYYSLLVNKVPEGKWRDEGSPLHTIAPVSTDEKIVSLVSVSDFGVDESLCFITEHGMAKKTSLAEYQTERSVAVKALKLRAGDTVRRVFAVTEANRIVTITERGFVGLFQQEEVSQMGKNAQGVKLTVLGRNDAVVDAYAVEKETPFHVVLFEKHGYYRVIHSQRIPGKKRGSKGTPGWRGLGSQDGIIRGVIRAVHSEGMSRAGISPAGSTGAAGTGSTGMNSAGASSAGAAGIGSRGAAGIGSAGFLQGACMVDGQSLQNFELEVTPTVTVPLQYAQVGLQSQISDVILMPTK